MNGDKLIADTSLGGTHRPEFDSTFNRIQKVSETQWVVTAKNGVRSIYSVGSQHSATRVTTWRLSIVADSYGNRVTYSYTPIDGMDYLSRISYGSRAVSGPYAVKFHYKIGNKISTAGSLASDYRGKIVKKTRLLSVVQVCYKSSNIRAYLMNHSVDPTTGVNLLASVVEYGSDAQVLNGAITSGTSLPPHRFIYDSENYPAGSRAKTTAYGLPEYHFTGMVSRAVRQVPTSGTESLRASYVKGPRPTAHYRVKPWNGYAYPEGQVNSDSLREAAFNGIRAQGDTIQFLGHSYLQTTKSGTAKYEYHWDSIRVPGVIFDAPEVLVGPPSANKWVMMANQFPLYSSNDRDNQVFKIARVDHHPSTRTLKFTLRVANRNTAFATSVPDRVWEVKYRGADGRNVQAFMADGSNGIQPTDHHKGHNGAFVARYFNLIKEVDGLVVLGDTGYNVSTKYRRNASSFAFGFVRQATVGKEELQVHGGVTRFVDLNGDGLKDAISLMVDEPRYWYGNAGKKREVLLNTGNGWQSSPQWNLPDGDFEITGLVRDTPDINGGTTHFVDLNGDQRLDAFTRVFKDGVGWKTYVRLNNGNGWTNTEQWKDVDDRIATAMWNPEVGISGPTFSFCELNGDGKADILMCYKDAPGFWWGSAGTVRVAYINTGSGWRSDPRYLLDVKETTAEGISDRIVGPGTTRLLDLNGDGLTDALTLVHEDGIGWYRSVKINTGEGWASAPNFDPDHHVATAMRRSDGTLVGGTADMPDLNGDGLPDLLISMYDDPGHWYGSDGWYRNAWLNTGAGWEPAPQFIIPSVGIEQLAFTGMCGGNSPATAYIAGGTISYGDFNNDGLADMCAYVRDQNGGWFGDSGQLRRVWINTASGWRRDTNYEVTDVNVFTGIVTTDNRVLRGTLDLVDLNGDGATDQMHRVYVDSGSVEPALVAGWRVGSYITKARRPLLSTVINPLGGCVSVAYKPIQKIEQIGASGMSGKVVDSISFHNNLGAVSIETLYHYYWNARICPTTRRFLGFEKAAVASDFGPVGWTTFGSSCDLPAGTIVEQSSGYTAGGVNVILDTIKTEYVVDTTAPHSVLVAKTTETQVGETGGSRSRYSTFSYDNYGNTRLAYKSADAQSGVGNLRTITSYQAPTSTYMAGLPTRVEVYSGQTDGTKLQQIDTVYDFAGMPLTVSAWLGGSDFAVTKMTYDWAGNLLTSTDSMGAKTSYKYDPTLNLYQISETNPLGHSSSTTYDLRMGVATETTDANGIVQANRHDVFGRIIGSSMNGIARVTTGYARNLKSSSASVLTGTNGWLNGSTLTDGFGREIERRGLEGTTYISYLGASEKITVQAGPGTTYTQAQTRKLITNYDAMGRTKEVIHPTGDRETVRYAIGQMIATDIHGKVTTHVSDMDGNKLQTTETAPSTTSRTTKYVYDRQARLLERTAPNGNRTRMTYNVVGKITTMICDTRGQISRTYDRAGREIWSRDSRGCETFTDYDSLGRVTRSEVKKNGMSFGKPYVYTYDGATRGKGLLFKANYSGGMRQISAYDLEGRPVAFQTTIGMHTKSFTQQFNLDGTLAEIGYPNGQKVRYGYNTAGQLSLVTGTYRDASGTSKSRSYASSFSYSTAGELLGFDYGNGVRYLASFDPVVIGRVKQADYSLNTVNLFRQAFSYGPGSRITAVAETHRGGATRNSAFVYDRFSQLTSENHTGNVSTGAFNYAYDSSGNMTFNSGVGSYIFPSSGNRNAPVKIGPDQVTYDAAGNTAKIGSRIYVYDARGQLTETRGPSSSDVSSYDDTGNRTKHHSRKTQGGVTQQSLLFFDKFFELRSDDSGLQASNLIYAGERLIARQPVADANYEGTSYKDPEFYHSDHLGSLRLVTSISGATVMKQDFSAYGVHMENGTLPFYSFSNGFTGHTEDRTTGLVYMGSRFYDPRIGRFISPDSMDTDDMSQANSLNAYTYVMNQPTIATDPDGHFWNLIIAGIQGLVNWANTGHFTFDYQLTLASHSWGGAPGGSNSPVESVLTENTYLQGINGLGNYYVNTGFELAEVTIARNFDLTSYERSSAVAGMGFLDRLNPFHGYFSGGGFQAAINPLLAQMTPTKMNGAVTQALRNPGMMQNLVNFWISTGGKLGAVFQMRGQLDLWKTVPMPGATEVTFKYTLAFRANIDKKKTGSHLTMSLTGGDLMFEGKLSGYGGIIGPAKVHAISALGRAGLYGAVGYSFPLIRGVPTINGGVLKANFGVFANVAFRLFEVGWGDNKVNVGEIGWTGRLNGFDYQHGTWTHRGPITPGSHTVYVSPIIYERTVPLGFLRRFGDKSVNRVGASYAWPLN